ncbi:unnamed protein product [Mycena citricolor]|uniref:Uncharacterized protein n=1 Tax=Mycena citricolor TaxID=2018698 RepID=A0AAD2HCG8_9AGAR|nr:unnamed protein product [Mycena citricolor]
MQSAFYTPPRPGPSSAPKISAGSPPPLLFATPSPRASTKPSVPRFIAPSAQQGSTRAYLAFPPNSPPIRLPSAAPHTPPRISASAPAPSPVFASPIDNHAREREKAADDAFAAAEAHRAALHRTRMERANAEALKGEIDWVRSGGVLRDAEGNRDYARTETIREELRVAAVEKAVTERWDAYEGRWAALRGANAAVAAASHDQGTAMRFADVPWPIASDGPRPVGVGDLTTEKIEEFLFASLKVRGATVTKKERIRSSLLRWHPDKMTAILSRVADEDAEIVRSGIHAVVLCLHQLNAANEAVS